LEIIIMAPSPFELNDWKQDSWFAEHHADRITPEFAAWWFDYYGLPDSYVEQDEYWARCSFCLDGWLGHADAAAKSP